MTNNDQELANALGLLNAASSPELEKNFSYIESAVGVVIGRVSTILDNGNDALELDQLRNITDILATTTEICEKLGARRTLDSACNALQHLLK